MRERHDDAAPPGDTPTRIFFSGHSLMEAPVPDHVGRIAHSIGRPIEWDYHLVGGSTIRWRVHGRDRETGWAGLSSGRNRHGTDMDVCAEWRRLRYDILSMTEQRGVIDALVWEQSVRQTWRHLEPRAECTAAICAAALDRRLVERYFAHVRDDHWAKREGLALRNHWRRLRRQWRTRRRLSLGDLFAWRDGTDSAF